jgi:hypothetical protein
MTRALAEHEAFLYGTPDLDSLAMNDVSGSAKRMCDVTVLSTAITQILKDIYICIYIYMPACM